MTDIELEEAIHRAKELVAKQTARREYLDGDEEETLMLLRALLVLDNKRRSAELRAERADKRLLEVFESWGKQIDQNREIMHNFVLMHRRV